VRQMLIYDFYCCTRARQAPQGHADGKVKKAVALLDHMVAVKEKIRGVI
jgi:hypothetical protein